MPIDKLHSQNQNEYIKMTQSPISKLIVSLSIPTIISMLITSIYNMVDTFFVSKLGTSATGAVGIVFSVMALIQAIGFMLGAGSGNIVSRRLGKQDEEGANQVASTGFFMALALGALLMIFGLLFLNPFMRLLGATKTILPYARDYAKYILFGAPVMCASFVLNNLLRGQGRATLAMIGIAFGGILNIILDPLLIFTFEMGISGAAIATLISQVISFLILLYFFLAGKSAVRLSIRKMSYKAHVYKRIMTNGFPSLCRQGLASLAAIALNINAGLHGDAAVAAMSIVSRIFMLIVSVMIGFGQGFMPVVGFNYGAKKYDRVREAFWFSVKTGLVFMAILSMGGFIFSEQLIGLFRKEDAEVMAIGILACRLQCLALPLQPVMVLSNMLFQSIGKSWQASLLSSMRQGIYFLPLIMILPRAFGVLGVQMAQPIADTLTFMTCIPFIIRLLRELKENGLY